MTKFLECKILMILAIQRCEKELAHYRICFFACLSQLSISEHKTKIKHQSNTTNMMRK